MRQVLAVFFYLLACTAMTAEARAACDTAPAQGSDPSREELLEAMRIAGVETPLRGAYAAAPACMPANLLGTYNKRGVIVLADDWRRVGGLTRLIHELRHHHQHETGQKLDECDAARTAALWADENGYTNEARRERAYGATACADARHAAAK